MKICLLVIGKTDADYIRAGIEEYEKRLRKYVGYEMKVLPDVKNTKHMSEALQKEKEGLLLLEQFLPTDYVILLDEPFSALDSFLRQEMEREVQQVLQSFGGVSILVSHNKEEIFRLTQKCMVMERGKIAEIGDTKEIFAHPKTAEGRLLIQGGSL